MEIICLEPEQRLSQRNFYQVKNSSKGSRRFFIYTCPYCQQKIRFVISDLLKAHQSDSFGVGLLYRKLFHQKYQLENKKNLFFKDFHCSACFRPVRIIYKIPFNSPNRYSLKIIKILEIISYHRLF